MHGGIAFSTKTLALERLKPWGDYQAAADLKSRAGAAGQVFEISGVAKRTLLRHELGRTIHAG